jgi:hypothetical protein
MKKQMKAIDLPARKLGDEHLVPGAAALVRFCFPLWGLFEWAEGPGTATAGDCHRKGPAPASRPFLS